VAVEPISFLQVEAEQHSVSWHPLGLEVEPSFFQLVVAVLLLQPA
jgi:hypothetical protein